MSEQPQGNFYARPNRYKQPGDNKPVFQGHVTKPGDEAEYPLALWAHEYTDPKSGEVKVMYTGTVGQVARNLDAHQYVAAMMNARSGEELTIANLSIRPGQVVLFPNGFKGEAPEKNRPDLWGGINFGDGTPVVRPSVWAKQFDDGTPYLSGATSFPIPGKSEREQQEAGPQMSDLLASGAVTKGMPERKGRKAAGGRG